MNKLNTIQEQIDRTDYEGDWDSWREEFHEKWVNQYEETVQADPKQLMVWIDNLLKHEQNRLLDEVLKKLNNLHMPLSNQGSDTNYDKQARYWNKEVKEIKSSIEELKEGVNE